MYFARVCIGEGKEKRDVNFTFEGVWLCCRRNVSYGDGKLRPVTAMVIVHQNRTPISVKLLKTSISKLVFEYILTVF